MTISVVIATYNRASLLEECLHHLARQPFERGDEVVVVDNGSSDRSGEVIERARAAFAVPLRHLQELAPGKSRALARASGVATGDILAMTDDDVNVESGWLDAIRAVFADGRVALTGGPVAPRWETPAPRWVRAAAESDGRLMAPLALLNYGPDPIALGPRCVIGANMAVRRDVFVRLGGFASHLGKLRGTLLSGEDHDLCNKVRRDGLLAVYCPGARVQHWVPADRMRLRYYLSWFFWSGITHATLEADEPNEGPCPPSLLGVPLYLLRRALVALPMTLAASIAGNVRAALERAVDVAFTAGYVTHRWRGSAQS